MDYKSKLQTNNTALDSNNLDLQTILNTINALPEASSGEAINLDAEITAQDAVIAQIQTALEGKAAGGGDVVEYNTCKLNVNVTGGSYAMTAQFDMVVVNESAVECVYDQTKYNVGKYDVLCNSTVNVRMNTLMYALDSIVVDGVAEDIYVYGDFQLAYFKVPNENGATVQVDIVLT